MMIPFGDSILALGLLLAIGGCALVVFFAIYRWLRYKRISRRLLASASAAALVLTVALVAGVMEDDIEVNPVISSAGELVGTYSNGGQAITLNADGSYVAKGLPGPLSGTWTHNDWNLSLWNPSLKSPRIVTRNGVLCIAPFYAGVDDPMGVLLKKE